MTMNQTETAQVATAVPEHTLEEIEMAIRLQGLEPLDIPPAVSVADLAGVMEVGPVEVIKELMRSGYMFTINDVIEHSVAASVAPGVRVRTSAPERRVGPRLRLDLHGIHRRGRRGSGRSRTSPTGDHDTRPCGPRQDDPLGHHPQRQHRRGRGRRDYTAHRRLPARLPRDRRNLPRHPWTRRLSPPCAQGAPR